MNTDDCYLLDNSPLPSLFGSLNAPFESHDLSISILHIIIVGTLIGLVIALNQLVFAKSDNFKRDYDYNARFDCISSISISWKYTAVCIGL